MTIDKFKFEVTLADSGLSMKDLAERAGVSRQRISTMLNQRNVTPRTAGKIARALGVDVLEIIEVEK